MLSPPYSPHLENATKRESHGSTDIRVASALSSSSLSGYTTSIDEFTDIDSDTSSGTSTPVYSYNSLKRTTSVALEPDTSLSKIQSDECSQCDADAPLTPQSRKVRLVSSWKLLKSDPARYRREQQQFLALYPMQVPGQSLDEPEIAENAPTSGRTRAVRGKRTKLHRPIENIPPSLRGRRRATDVSVDYTAGDESEEVRETGSSYVRVHDLNFNQIEDFSPPLHLLPPGKSLRAEWKGAPMDLSTDKDLHLLHPAEAHLASVLRLPCDVYLDSKRRLFAEKVHRLRQGLPFRRTDSQKACRIDVNKASRLFGAFEKIGWLEDDLFLQYLN